MNRAMKYTIVLFVIFVVIIPIFVMLTWAFAERWIYPELLPEGFTLRYIVRGLTSGIITKPMMNSMLLAFIVTGASFLLGYPVSKHIGTVPFRGKRFIQVFVLLPALAPGITVVFGMLPVFVKLGIYQTFAALVIGQMTFTLPYMIMMLSSAFKNYDKDYEAQSATLGISKIDTFLYVTLPLIKSSAAVACMYTFMVSWSMYLFTSMYSPRGFDTLVSKLFPMLGPLSTTSMHDIAVFAIFFFLPSLIFLVATTLIIRSDRVNERGANT